MANANEPEIVIVSEESNEKRLCRHHDTSCIIHSLKGLLRGLLIGYGIRTAIGLLSALIMRRLYKNPKKLFQVAFLAKENIDMSLFVGLYTFGFKGNLSLPFSYLTATNCLLRALRKKEDGINSFVAGAVAGSSMLFWESTEIALYLSARAAESIFNGLVSRGYMKSYYYGDSFLFSLSTAFMFYAFVWEPANLRPSYHKFLMRVSKGRDIVREGFNATLLPPWLMKKR